MGEFHPYFFFPSPEAVQQEARKKETPADVVPRVVVFVNASRSNLRQKADWNKITHRNREI